MPHARAAWEPESRGADVLSERDRREPSSWVFLYEGNAYWKRNDTVLRPPHALRRDVVESAGDGGIKK